MRHRAHQGDEVRRAMALGVPLGLREKSLIAVLCRNELGGVASNNHLGDFHCIKASPDGPSGQPPSIPRAQSWTKRRPV